MEDNKHCIDASSGAEESVENMMDQEEPLSTGKSDEIKEKKLVENLLDQDEPTLTEEEEDTQEDEKKVINEEFDDFIKISHNDEEEEPRMVLIQGKNRDYLSSRKKVNEILRTASFHRGFKKVYSTSFKVTEFKNQQYSSEYDVEVKKNGEKGKAKVTIYKDNKKKEGKKEQTIMITKKAKNESKFVRKVTENVIQPLLEGFSRKEIKIEDIVNETKEESEVKCDMCDKKCLNDQGLALHKSRMHDKKKKIMGLNFECGDCEGKFQTQKLLNDHVIKLHKKLEDKMECDSIKRVHSTSPGVSKKRKR